MSLFVVSSILLVDIFTITQKTQVKLSGQTRVQADARYVMEILSRYARNYMIDYQYIVDQEGADPIPHQLNYLPLKDTMGNSIIFESSVSPTICPTGVNECLVVRRNDSANASITPEGVNIKEITFYILPDRDPFVIDPATGGYRSDQQPQVTIVLVSETTSERTGEKQTNYLQTTVSSRIYKRY